MTQPPISTPAVPPKPLRAARVILWIQTGLVALGTILEFVAIAELTDHGEEVGAYNTFAVIDNVVVVVIALIAALFIVKRRSAWGLAFFVEALAGLNGILNLVHGAFLGVVEIGLAIGVVVLLLNPQVTNWFQETSSPESIGPEY